MPLAAAVILEASVQRPWEFRNRSSAPQGPDPPSTIEHILQPWLGGIPRQALPALLHRIEDILYEVATDVEPLYVVHVVQWGRST